MRYVFGPVPSRRLGRSLGIDPIPFKTCNWNCVYCQLGRTSPPTRERARFVPPEDIVAEVDAVLCGPAAGEVDWVTFVGSGEPTLHADLGWMIRALKARVQLPIAVITNGALLADPAVRAELSVADAVMPSLDAADERQYLRINRPATGGPSFDDFLRGLVDFRSALAGKLWLEVMVIRGLNDDEASLRGIAEHIARIQPDAVHVNVPIRPPAEPWVEPPDAEGTMRAVALLGAVARALDPPSHDLDLPADIDASEAVAAIVLRHPMRERDVLTALGRWSRGEVESVVQALLAARRIQRVERFGESFLTAPTGRYRQPRVADEPPRRGCV